MTETQMQIADTLDEMQSGDGVEFTGGLYVERDGETYCIGDERLCFMQAYERVVAFVG